MLSYRSIVGSMVRTNEVLRNTFLLLALTLVPTIGGVMIGINSGLSAWAIFNPLTYISSKYGLF